MLPVSPAHQYKNAARRAASAFELDKKRGPADLDQCRFIWAPGLASGGALLQRFQPAKVSKSPARPQAGIMPQTQAKSMTKSTQRGCKRPLHCFWPR